LELRGHAVEIILPKYASMRYSDIWDLQPSYRDMWVPWYGEQVNCTVWFGYASGRKCFFHRAALGGQLLRPGPALRILGRRGTVRVLFQGGSRIHVPGQQASRYRSLPRLADRARPGPAA